MSALAAIALTLAAQAGMTERLDPALPEVLRATVAQAAEAELDDNRGPSNAQAVLDAAQDKHRSDPNLVISLKLRDAAIELRKKLRGNERLPEAIRWEKAFTTFARLDLTEPGLKAWFDRTLANHAYAKKKLGTKKQRTLKAALLVRGADLDKKTIQAAFEKGLKTAGFSIDFVPAKQAEVILKVGVESMKQPNPRQRAARVTLGLESWRDGKLIWRHSMFRAEAANEMSVAANAALDWLVRIGGRDLLFRWLGERAFHTILEPGRFSLSTGQDLERGSGTEDDGHNHGKSLFGDIPVPKVPGKK
ncbi:MAG: hypothetical protein RMA76_29370 [Deltaproteobacteria bacterium]